MQGITEATCTVQNVRSIERFILYLIRYSRQTIHPVGNNTYFGEILEKFKELYKPDDIDESTTTICKLYTEEKKEIKSRIGKSKSKTSTSIIKDLIDQHNINTAQEWENKIEEDIKIQLLQEFGLSVDSYI